MHFKEIILSKFRSTIVYILIIGFINSLLNGALLVFINYNIANTPLPAFNQYRVVIFILIVLSSLVCTRYFQVYMINLTCSITFDFEVHVMDKLKKSSLLEFENIGTESVYTAINDTRVLAHVPEVLISSFNSLIVVICCFSYMFFISVAYGLSILATIGLLLIIYLIRNKGIERDLNIQRDLQNAFFKYLNDCLAGFKDIKINRDKGNRLFDHHILPNRRQNKDISVKTGIKYLDNELTGTYSWYVVFGVILFVLPVIFQNNSHVSAVYLVTILYMIGPIAILITLIPTITSIKIALERLNVFNEKLLFKEAETFHGASRQDHAFDSIEFVDMKFSYNSDSLSKRQFVVGPVNLEIRRGETIFIIGGNGSGKSTFGYLLSGLYFPSSGLVKLNGETMTIDNIQVYRDHFSAIFTDSHLFSENYERYNFKDDNSVFQSIVEELKMTDVIDIDKETNQIGRNLSTGQRKRLLLIYAILEEKPIILLDEWAAEQDPSFRAYFYNELLPSLKKKGKTVIVITHDDEFYSHASRIIKFDYGNVIEDITVASKSIFQKELRQSIN